MGKQRSLQMKHRKRNGVAVDERTHPRRVDYHVNSTDFLCVLLASIGLSTDAICERTGLTASQVLYRIWKAEDERNNGAPTARMAYRKGQGAVVERVISSVTTGGNAVKRTVVDTLEKRDLYTPRPTGVLHDKLK